MPDSPTVAELEAMRKVPGCGLHSDSTIKPKYLRLESHIGAGYHAHECDECLLLLVRNIKGRALAAVIALLMDDGYAITFQTMGQYRSGLVKNLAGKT